MAGFAPGCVTASGLMVWKTIDAKFTYRYALLLLNEIVPQKPMGQRPVALGCGFVSQGKEGRQKSRNSGHCAQPGEPVQWENISA
jgi:hypothetical protein